MNDSESKAPPRLSEQVRPLLEAQVAGAVTCASLYAQWAGIAAGVVRSGADRVADLAADEHRRFPDSYENLATGLLRDYVRGLREAAALQQTGALRFAREMQKLSRDDG